MRSRPATKPVQREDDLSPTTSCSCHHPQERRQKPTQNNWRRRHITPSRTDKSPGGPLERGLQQRPQLAREVVAAEHLLVGRVAVLVQ